MYVSQLVVIFYLCIYWFVDVSNVENDIDVLSSDHQSSGYMSAV